MAPKKKLRETSRSANQGQGQGRQEDTAASAGNLKQWIVIKWAHDGSITVQPSDTLIDDADLQDTGRLRRVYYTGEGEERPRPPYTDLKHYSGYVIKTGSSCEELLNSIPELPSASTARRLTEPWKTSNQESHPWMQTRRVVKRETRTHESDSSTTSTMVKILRQYKTKIQQQDEQIQILKKRLTDLESVEKRVEALERRKHWTKEEIITLIKNVNDEQRSNLTNAEAALLTCIPSNKLQEAKRLQCSGKMAMELLTLATHGDWEGKTISEVDPVKVKSICEFVHVEFKRRGAGTEAITEDAVRQKMRKAMDNRKRYIIDKSMGKKRLRTTKSEVAEQQEAASISDEPNRRASSFVTDRAEEEDEIIDEDEFEDLLLFN